MTFPGAQPEPEEVMTQLRSILFDELQYSNAMEAAKDPAQLENYLQGLLDLDKVAESKPDKLDVDVDNLINGDPELQEMQRSLQAGKFETRGCPLADRWAAQKKSDADLAQRYAAVGNKYSDQRAFRQTWLREQFELVKKNKESRVKLTARLKKPRGSTRPTSR